ncbi:MAG: Gldg family protein, partial [Gammaproteobacteria bacterium]
MTTKEKRSLGGSALVILAVLFLALTVLSNVLFKGVRLDLTEHKLYTISEGTENILADIEEPVNLYYFFSDRATENIPYLRTYAKRVRELLQEIALKSGGKIRLTELDPLPFSEE